MNEPQAHKAAENRKAQQQYDFPDVSDMCDFGYALAPRDETKDPAPKPAE